MRLESVPLILGVLLGLLGLALILDAWLLDDVAFGRERRARPRLDRDRQGEALVGLGVIAMAIAFFARDFWKYRIVTVMVGSVLMLWGAWRNAGYLKAVLARSTRNPPPLSHVTPEDSLDHHSRAPARR
jgi:hypothetical protein